MVAAEAVKEIPGGMDLWGTEAGRRADLLPPLVWVILLLSESKNPEKRWKNAERNFLDMTCQKWFDAKIK